MKHEMFSNDCEYGSKETVMSWLALQESSSENGSKWDTFELNSDSAMDKDDSESWLKVKPLTPISTMKDINGFDDGFSRHDSQGDYSDLPSSQLINTTELIVQYLLAQGLKLDDIIIPRGTKGMITYISLDFDEPLDEFEEYI